MTFEQRHAFRTLLDLGVVRARGATTARYNALVDLGWATVSYAGGDYFNYRLTSAVTDRIAA